jgi:hypothetical protein
MRGLLHSVSRFMRTTFKSLSREIREIILDESKTKDDLQAEIKKLKYPIVVRRGALYYWGKKREL